MGSKYNAKKTVIDDITFDSIAESKYYLYLKEKQEKGEIQAFNLQPVFTLQEGFRKNGKWVRPILYIADFEVLHNDETVEIIDIKGQLTPVFQLKYKMFEKKFEHSLTLMKYVKKFGGFVTLEEWKQRRKEETKK